MLNSVWFLFILLWLPCVTVLGFPDEHGPFSHKPEPQALAKAVDTASNYSHPEATYDSFESITKYTVTNSNETITFSVTCSSNQWSMTIQKGTQEYEPYLYSEAYGFGGGSISEIYATDLNRDKSADFIIPLYNGGFCGLNAGLNEVMVILSRKDEAPVAQTYWTYSFSAEDIVDLDRDGKAEIIVSSHTQEEAKDGKVHSYWVYDRHEIQGTELKPIRTEEWPIWVWHTFKENHQNTTHFTRNQKNTLWAKYLQENGPTFTKTELRQKTIHDPSLSMKPNSSDLSLLIGTEKER